MKIRIATYNLENLFTRPAAMAEGSGAAGQQAIDDHAELNRIVSKPLYADADRARLVALAARYGFALPNPSSRALVFLNNIRGRLYRRAADGTVSVDAAGRDAWTGWFELKMSDIKWQASYNTARVIAEVNPDILLCVEADNRPTLQRFNQQLLGATFKRAYPHVMVIDGNDDRGIDVGILSRYPVSGVRPHVDDKNPNGEKTFSRDCPEYVVQLAPNKQIVVIPNHFKSKRGGDTPASKARRLAQATAASAIASNALHISPLVLVGGDLNDTPTSAPLQPMWQGGFTEVSAHASYPTDRPGTYGTGTASQKIDYLILSPALGHTLQRAGIERRGSYHPTLWPPFDTVRNDSESASDHHLVWADFEV